MASVIVVVVAFGLVFWFATRAVARRQEEALGYGGEVLTPAARPPATSPTEPSSVATGGGDHTRAGVDGLTSLLAGVALPDDLVPFTRGLRPDQLETRLVLWTDASTHDIRDRLSEALASIGIDVVWDGLHGRGEGRSRALMVVLHPPVDPATVEVPPPKRKRGPKSIPPPLERPDFPGVPFSATVVDLSPEGRG